jgi:hypothetical protein
MPGRFLLDRNLLDGRRRLDKQASNPLNGAFLLFRPGSRLKLQKDAAIEGRRQLAGGRLLIHLLGLASHRPGKWSSCEGIRQSTPRPSQDGVQRQTQTSNVSYADQGNDPVREIEGSDSQHFVKGHDVSIDAGHSQMKRSCLTENRVTSQVGNDDRGIHASEVPKHISARDRDIRARIHQAHAERSRHGQDLRVWRAQVAR